LGTSDKRKSSTLRAGRERVTKYEHLDGFFAQFTQRKMDMTFGKCKLRYKDNIKINLYGIEFPAQDSKLSHYRPVQAPRIPGS